MPSFKTIDLDTKRGTSRIIGEILKCKYLCSLTIEESSSGRGWHIKLWCNKACLRCRQRFDDAHRFTADMTNRKPYQRDVLFNKKTLHFPEKGLVIINEKGKKQKVIKTHKICLNKLAWYKKEVK